MTNLLLILIGLIVSMMMYSMSAFADSSIEKQIVELTSGGQITDAVAVGTALQYTVKNNGDIIPAFIRFSDLSGNVIFQNQINLAKQNTAGEFNISHLAAGTYFLSVQTDLWQTSLQVFIVK